MNHLKFKILIPVQVFKEKHILKFKKSKNENKTKRREGKTEKAKQK